MKTARSDRTGRCFSLSRDHSHSLIRFFFLVCLLCFSSRAIASSDITAIWANDGGDKVTRDDLRATRGQQVINSIWDGTTIGVFGARNEVIGFNVILEAGNSSASNVTVTLNGLTGPNGASILFTPTTGDGVFSWTQRQIELFYVRYLQINGLSKVSYETYDERHIPKRLERPWSGDGYGYGLWTDRPDHNKYYPEIAVPLELVPTFTISGGSNQSIWVDIYIPKTVPPGLYTGNLVVKEGGTLVQSVPVQLSVYSFSLPDTPNNKTMLYFDSGDINWRFFGNNYVNPNSPQGRQASLLRDRYTLLAHRHRMSMIGDDESDDCSSSADQPCPDWLPRLNGSLFTSANGYDGPGVGVGNNVYSIGTYGSWSWMGQGEQAMWTHTNNWATWFDRNAPGNEVFLYLLDESTRTADMETWSSWILNNPGSGHEIKSMATIDLRTAASQCPDMDIPTSTFGVGIASQWQPLDDRYTHDPRKRFFLYNAHRPADGSFATDDDGVALRELAWVQYKKNINRWFFWQSTYYNNYQAGMGQTNVFENAQTFGAYTPPADPVLGQTGWNYSNGDGVLFYPGTDVLFPSDSYGVNGAFASLRLKLYRRGIQDYDYLTLASAVNPSAVSVLVSSMVPKALWEYGVTDPSDPTYVRTPISWSIDPNVWESARAQLANIIAGGSPYGLPPPTLNLPSTLPVNAQISCGYPPGYTISSYNWTVQAAGSNGQVSGGGGLKSNSSTSTPAPALQLGGLSLSLGYYQISVTATDNTGLVSPPATAYVTLVSGDLGAIRIYPNPWRSDKYPGVPVKFDHLAVGTTLKIFTLSGHWVKTLQVSNGEAAWDLTNDAGEHVASGIYLYVAKTPDDQMVRGKIGVIR